jgi:cysteine desulfurase family protein
MSVDEQPVDPSAPGFAERTTYLDHAATSWPKPPEVVDAMVDALVNAGGNPGRGAYRLAVASSRLVHAARSDVSAFLGVARAEDLVFQPGCTAALNLVMKGLVRPGDRVVTTTVEHNAVARPLARLAREGVEVVTVSTSPEGIVGVDRLEAALADAPTRLVVAQHAGNVTGAVQPISDIVAAAHAAGALVLVDGAQAVGHLDVDLAALGADAYAASGHKALLGPQGIGVLHLDPSCDPLPLVEGGTGGGLGESAEQPDSRPERYEAGTGNLAGIAGLGAAIRFLAERVEGVRAEERRLARRLHEGILELPGFRVLGPPPGVERVPIVSAVHEVVPADRFAALLDREYGIAVRSGLHCATGAHETLGTLDAGALRFGVGYSTTDADIDLALGALAELERRLR